MSIYYLFTSVAYLYKGIGCFYLYFKREYIYLSEKIFTWHSGSFLFSSVLLFDNLALYDTNANIHLWAERSSIWLGYINFTVQLNP